MKRHPRLTVIENTARIEKKYFKDHITGEVINKHKIIQRLSEGVYSSYHIHHLNLHGVV